MLRKFCLLILLYLGLFAPQIWSQTSIRTYLPSYRMKQFFPQDLSGQSAWYKMQPYSQIMHARKDMQTLPISYDMASGERLLNRFERVYYFAISPAGEDGEFLSSEKWADLKYLKRLSKSHVGLTIFGKSADFIPLSKVSDIQKDFFSKLGYLVRNYNLKAIDVDWEFPRNQDEKEAYLKLLQKLDELCVEEGIELTIAVSRFRPLNPEIYELADYINLMNYDFYGKHSTVKSSLEAVDHMMSKFEIPSSKIFMGIPYYGRIFDGYSPDYWKKAMSYREIVRTESPAPSEDEAGGYYFNGQETIKEKAELIKEMNLAGAFIWEIGQDTIDSTSLSKVLHYELSP